MAGTENCCFCEAPPAGPMFKMGSETAHAECVLRKLNELLEPSQVVGFLGVKGVQVGSVSSKQLEEKLLKENRKRGW